MFPWKELQLCFLIVRGKECKHMWTRIRIIPRIRYLYRDLLFWGSMWHIIGESITSMSFNTLDSSMHSYAFIAVKRERERERGLVLWLWRLDEGGMSAIWFIVMYTIEQKRILSASYSRISEFVLILLVYIIKKRW